MPDVILGSNNNLAQQAPIDNPNPSPPPVVPPSVPAPIASSVTPPASPLPVNATKVIVAPIEEPKNGGGAIKKLLLIIVLLLIIGGAGVGGYYVYSQVLNNPSKLLTESFTKLGDADSFTTGVTFADIPEAGRISLSFDYQKDTNKYGKAEFRFDNIVNNPNDYLTISSVYRKDEIYLMSSFTKMAELESEITLAMPEITAMKTYQLLAPVLNGQKWLMIRIPKETSPNFNSVSPSPNKYELTEEQEKELKRLSLSSLSLRSYNRNFSYNSKTYSRIAFGLKKKELLDLVEYLKSLKIDVQLADINNLKQVIESVDADAWNSELVEILIDKTTKVPYLVSFSLPEIPKDVLDKSLSQAESDSKSNITSMLDQKELSNGIDNFFNQNKKGKLIYLGKVVFTNYNSVPPTAAPMNVVDFNLVATAAEEELLPLFGSMLMGGSGNSNPLLPEPSPYPAQ